jgi:hypothetical protein
MNTDARSHHGWLQSLRIQRRSELEVKLLKVSARVACVVTPDPLWLTDTILRRSPYGVAAVMPTASTFPGARDGATELDEGNVIVLPSADTVRPWTPAGSSVFVVVGMAVKYATCTVTVEPAETVTGAGACA